MVANCGAGQEPVTGLRRVLEPVVNNWGEKQEPAVTGLRRVQEPVVNNWGEKQGSLVNSSPSKLEGVPDRAGACVIPMPDRAGACVRAAERHTPSPPSGYSP